MVTHIFNPLEREANRAVMSSKPHGRFLGEPKRNSETLSQRIKRSIAQAGRGHPEAHQPLGPPAVGAPTMTSMWWRDGAGREAEWFAPYEERQNRRLEGKVEQPSVSSLPCYLKPW